MRVLTSVAATAAALLVPVATTAADAPRASDAVWSPDGRTLAFVEQTADGGADVHTVGADESDARNVTGDDTRSMLYTTQRAPHFAPAWSRGGRLAYVVARGAYTRPYFEYWVASADGSDKHFVAWEPTDQRPSWSPDGTELTMESYEAIVSARISEGATTTAIVGAGNSLWSPRDPRIAVGAVAPRSNGNNVDVYTVRADGSHRHRLTTARGSDWPIAWSRDARRIAFATQRLIVASNGRSGIVALFVMDSNGQHQHRVGTGESADFSPDGNRLVYSDKRDVYVVGVDGRHRRLLAANATLPQWSPDGRWISFTSGNTVGLIHPDGSERHTLVS